MVKGMKKGLAALGIFFFLTSSFSFGKTDAPSQEENEKNIGRIKQQIEEKIQKAMGGVHFNIYFNIGLNRLKDLQDDSFHLEDISFNPNSKFFTAKIVFKTDQAAIKIGGYVACVQKVPVSSRLISPGELIQEADVQWVETDKSSIFNRAAVWGSLQGATPRRVIEPGKIIHTQDIQKPLCIEVGDVVAVVYHTKGLMMRTLVKALESGAKGEIIRVQNQESKKIFSVRVENDHETKIVLMTGK